MEQNQSSADDVADSARVEADPSLRLEGGLEQGVGSFADGP